MMEHNKQMWDRLHREGYKGYSFNAQAYHIVSQLPPNWLRPDMTALEIGVGEGHYLKDMAPLVKTIHGIDISEEAVKLAGEYLKDTPNAHVQVCNGESIPYPDESFDLIYSIATFQHIPRAATEKYLRNARRCIKPNGLILFQVISRVAPEQNLTDITCPESEETLGWNEVQLRSLVDGAGLRLVSLVDNSELVKPRTDVYWYWITCSKE